MTVAGGLGGTGQSGCVPNYLEVSRSWSSVIYSAGNTLGTLPGFATPLVAAALTDAFPGLSGWRALFWVSLSVQLVGGAAFGALAVAHDIV